MNIERLNINGTDIAVISSDGQVISGTQSALDLAMTVKYEAGTRNITISKGLICEDFFVLNTGMAGEILQKFVNYHVRAAIYGDYSHYTSKPLRDFIYDSNRGKNFFFVATKEEAVQKPAETQ